MFCILCSGVHILRPWPMIGLEQVERRDVVASCEREGTKLIGSA